MKYIQAYIVEELTTQVLRAEPTCSRPPQCYVQQYNEILIILNVATVAVLPLHVYRALCLRKQVKLYSEESVKEDLAVLQLKFDTGSALAINVSIVIEINEIDIATDVNMAG